MLTVVRMAFHELLSYFVCFPIYGVRKPIEQGYRLSFATPVAHIPQDLSLVVSMAILRGRTRPLHSRDILQRIFLLLPSFPHHRWK